MINVDEVKAKILRTLDEKGPSLPIHISRAIELEPMFASALLSELVSAQRVKMSKLKVGSSPLYLIPGQEEKLETFAEENLGGAEKTAYLKLKKEKIINDETQEPAIRVALRAISDFAVPIRYQDKIVWKYSFITNDEARNLLQDTPTKKNEEKEITQEPQKEKEEKQEINQKKPENIFDEKEDEEEKKPKKKKKPKKNAEEFLSEVKEFLLSKDIEYIKDSEISKKEIIAEVRINSDLGKISFLMVAKDKKRPSLSDLTKAKKEATFEKMPCYFLAKGDPASTAKDFLEENKNILKIGKF